MSRQDLLRRIQELAAPMEPTPSGMEPEFRPCKNVKVVALDFYGTMFISGVGDIGVDEGVSREQNRMFSKALVDSGFVPEGDADQVGEKGLHIFEEQIQKYESVQRKTRNIDHPEPDIVEIWKEVLQRLEEVGYISGDITAEASRKFAVEYEFRFNPVWPMPDLEETLSKLTELGCRLGIISNSQFYTPLAFQALTSNDLSSAGFDSRLRAWSYREGVKKPSLSLYRSFLEGLKEEYGIQAGQVLYVGNDMLKDMKPAAELGFQTALFAGDKRSLRLRENESGCRDVEPDIIVTRLSQMPSCLQ